MTDRTGQQLGNYRLTTLLGRGGFADVYLGEHIYLRTHAAVKVLQTRYSELVFHSHLQILALLAIVPNVANQGKSR